MNSLIKYLSRAAVLALCCLALLCFVVAGCTYSTATSAQPTPPSCSTAQNAQTDALARTPTSPTPVHALKPLASKGQTITPTTATTSAATVRANSAQQPVSSVKTRAASAVKTGNTPTAKRQKNAASPSKNTAAKPKIAASPRQAPPPTIPVANAPQPAQQSAPPAPTVQTAPVSTVQESEVALPSELREEWTGQVYASTFRVGICIDQQGSARGVLLLRVPSGKIDVYHFRGTQDAEGVIRLRHSSGHSFKGKFVDDATVTGEGTLKSGLKAVLTGKRIHNAPLSQDTCRPKE